jgi:hypothetical protein
MPRIASDSASAPRAGTHGNKYLTAIVLGALAAGMFVATVTHLFF